MLIGAGGFAYYLAKRSINADRAVKALDDVEWRKKQDQMRISEREYRDYMLTKSKGIREMKDDNRDGGGSGSPAEEASLDPAPTRHAPTSEGQRTLEKSKYEAREVFKAPKGDRFTTNIFGGGNKKE